LAKNFDWGKFKERISKARVVRVVPDVEQGQRDKYPIEVYTPGNGALDSEYFQCASGESFQDGPNRYKLQMTSASLVHRNPAIDFPLAEQAIVEVEDE